MCVCVCVCVCVCFRCLLTASVEARCRTAGTVKKVSNLKTKLLWYQKFTVVFMSHRGHHEKGVHFGGKKNILYYQKYTVVFDVAPRAPFKGVHFVSWRTSRPHMQ